MQIFNRINKSIAFPILEYFLDAQKSNTMKNKDFVLKQTKNTISTQDLIKRRLL